MLLYEVYYVKVFECWGPFVHAAIMRGAIKIESNLAYAGLNSAHVRF